jgi:hypothetical protein
MGSVAQVVFIYDSRLGYQHGWHSVGQLGILESPKFFAESLGGERDYTDIDYAVNAYHSLAQTRY